MRAFIVLVGTDLACARIFIFYLIGVPLNFFIFWDIWRYDILGIKGSEGSELCGTLNHGHAGVGDRLMMREVYYIFVIHIFMHFSSVQLCSVSSYLPVTFTRGGSLLKTDALEEGVLTEGMADV